MQDRGEIAVPSQGPEIRALAFTPAELQRVLTAERAGHPFLTWREQGKFALLPLPPDHAPRVTIGRGEECEIVLRGDPQVSRAHALLERVGGDWTLVDDGLSRNGSYVDGRRVVGRRRLGGGERICLGSSRLYFGLADQNVASETLTITESFATRTLSEMQRKVLIALCRPQHGAESAIPATNREIAAEVGLSEQAVKAHLRKLFAIFRVSELAQNEKRAELAARARADNLVSVRDF